MMRAGPLSNDKVIETLNKYYISAFVSQEDYKASGIASAEERQTFNAIALFTRKEKMSCGTVCGYILAPDGKVIDSGVVTLIIKDDALLKMLQANVEKLGTKPGKLVVKPTPQNAAPEMERGEMGIHVVARAEGTEPRKGGWRSYPGENWVILSKADQTKLIPTGKIAVGTSWTLDKSVTDRILIYFYPQSEDTNDTPHTVIESQLLTARVESVKNGIASGRIEGTLLMQHRFYPRSEPEPLNAAIVGYIEFDVPKKEVRTLKLVTTEANFGKTRFDVAAGSELPSKTR